ncbi:ATP-binding protein [uncultured Photobacterium sp.]|uniref:sensor histidine kinase n=1 Tax=uncultured Photobacterium sp. TaxID=173973 RepID=UPI00262241C3|nr:ATP-binding protein [uncultured Photobacterium sp.]
MRSGYFKSITFRVCFTLLVVIVIAEFIAGLIWFQANEETKKMNAKSTMLNIANAAADTYNYFQSLPVNYRHLILNQLREAGGTRFFISINNRYVPNENMPDYTFTYWLSDFTEKTLLNKLAIAKSVQVSITRREDVRVFNSGIKLGELPEIWTKYSLVLGELDLPILVMQIEMSEQEWFYIASVLPVPFSLLTTQFLDQRQLTFLVITSFLLMLCTALLLQKEIRPVKSLAKAATLMGAQFTVTEIKEEGSKETRAAVHAFNKMNQRVRSYIRDREMLFSAISHDLKTPLACLKLRTEMLDDENTKARFEKLLNEVDLMLKGALQCIRDTDIHEEPEWIDISQLLSTCADYYNRGSDCVSLENRPQVTYHGKPIAIKRCIHNLVDNAVLYGGKVDITIKDSKRELQISIRDYGPGIDNKLLEKVFEPYYRAERKDETGSGLGLTISRSIARTHGGDLKLQNHSKQGLEVHLILSREV